MEQAEQTKRRVFKKYTYQGIELDNLKKMPLSDLKKHLPSALRRHINRGFSQEEYDLITHCSQDHADEAIITTKCRNMMVLPVMIGKIIGIHNGNQFVEVEIKPDMISRRFKDLVPTKSSKAHGRPGVGATSSSKFVPLK